MLAQWNPIIPVAVPTAPIARSGTVNIGSAAAAAAPAGNPLLLLDAKAFGANKTIGHLQAGTWGTYTASDNWLEMGVYAPAYGGSNHYGKRMGWDKYGLTYGLSGGSTTRHAYATWSSNNSDVSVENNMYFQFNNIANTTQTNPLTLLSTALVGINQIVPLTRLHVVENNTSSPTIARFENIVNWTSSGSQYDANIELHNVTGTAGMLLTNLGTTIGSTSIIGHGYLGDLSFITGNSNTRMTLVDNTGFVGIGTASPGEKLEIYHGSVIMDKWVFDTRFGYGGDFLNIAPSNGSGGWDFTKGISLESATGNLSIANLSGGSTRMVTVDASGVLGSTTLPGGTQILSITGTVISLSGGGGSVSIPIDNSGNYTCASALNMTSQDITGAGDIFCGNIASGAIVFSGNATSASGDLTLTGGNLSVGGTATFGTFAGGGTTGADIDNSGNLIRTVSDRRLKTNIQNLNYGLNELLKLKSVKYNYIDTKKYGDSKTIGFIAQEVEEIMPEVVKQSTDAYHLRSLNYVEIIPVIVNAIKEQNDLIKEQKSTIEKQNQEILSLKNKVDCMSPCQATQAPTQPKTDIISTPRLDQNTPNPFGKTTTIAYYIPEGSHPNMLMLTDLNGKQIKNIIISQTGEGSITIDASELTPGIYNYSLIVNGKETLTKRMVVASY